VQKRLNRSRCRLGYGLGWAQGSMYYRWAQIPHANGQLLGERTCPGMPDDALPFGLWTRVGLKEAASSIVFARWRQCALMGGDIGATWRVRFQRPSAAAMRPYVTLLRPLVIRPHGRTTYVGAAYYHTPSSVVCWV